MIAGIWVEAEIRNVFKIMTFEATRDESDTINSQSDFKISEI